MLEIVGICNIINLGVFKIYKKFFIWENCMVFCLFWMLKYIFWFIKCRVEVWDWVVVLGGGVGVCGVERGEYNEGVVLIEGCIEGECFY